MNLHFDKAVKAKVLHVNARSENHGDKLVPAVDVRLELDLPNNTVLPEFAPDLLDALYDRPEVSPQASIPTIHPSSTHLRFPPLGPLKWREVTLHDQLTIDYGLGGRDSNVVLRQVKCHRHVLTLKEGGTVTVTVTASAANVSEQVLGRLGVRVQHEVHVLLTEGAPYVEEEDEDNDEAA